MNIWLLLILIGTATLLLIPSSGMRITETNKPAIGSYYYQRVNPGRKRKTKRWG